MGAADRPCAAVENEHRMVPRDEQVYGDGWTVADLADPAGYDFADRLASAK
jgi:hypothetical protein